MKVFLSHSSVDKPFVERLKSDLEKAGVATWYDKQDLLIGDEIEQKLVDGILDSAYFLIVASPDSLKSGWVKMELETGYEEYKTKKKRLLPVLYGKVEEKDIPQELQKHLYADFRKEDNYQDALLSLIKAILMNESTLRESVSNGMDKTLELEQLLIEGEVKQVLEKLLEITRAKGDNNHQTEVVLQLSRINSLERDNRMGILARSEYSVSKARINAAVKDLMGRVLGL